MVTGNRKKYSKKSSSDVPINRGAVRQMIRSTLMSNMEDKQYTATNSGTLSSAGAVVGITVNIAQGDNVSNRTGYQINLRHLELYYQASMNSAAGVDRFRVILFSDQQNNNVTPSVTDVLDTAAVLSGYNYYARVSNRFKVYMDVVIPMSINGNSRAVNGHRVFKIRDLPVSFSGTTGVNGQNGVFVLVMDDLGALNSTYALSWVLRFTDA